MLNPFFYPYNGGTEKVVLEVYSRLAKKHNITVITSAPFNKNKSTTSEVFGIKVVRLKTMHATIPIFPLPFLFFDGLKKALVKADCDLYHINNRYQYFNDTLSTVKGMNKKLALTVHNALPKNINPLTDKLGSFYDVQVWGRKLMHKMDLITGVSTNTINTTVPRKELKKTHLVFNGVDFHKYKKISKSDSNVRNVINTLDLGNTNIITNGRLVPQKGQKYLLRAVSNLVKKEDMDLHLLIVGNGQMKRELYLYARTLGMHKRFKITYGIDDDQLPYYYNACDVFSLPSLYEPAGLATLEALSCELPSVVSKIGGLPEMVGDCGLYSKPKDYYSIKERLKYLLENSDEASRLARKGRERMIKYHNWDKIAKQYEELFLKTIRY